MGLCCYQKWETEPGSVTRLSLQQGSSAYGMNRQPSSKRILSGLVLGLFLLRALIPAGFMPDAQMLVEGQFSLVACIASGRLAVHAASFDSSNPDGSDDSTQPPKVDCPYCPGFAKAFVASTTYVAIVAFPSVSNTGVLQRNDVPLWHAPGPPLGSRAPPMATA